MAKESKNVKNVDKTTKNKKSFAKDFKAELKKVIWTTSKQLVNSTVAVVSIVAVIVLLTLALDVAFEAINTKGINQIKALVTPNEVSNETLDEATVLDANTTDSTNESEESNQVTNESTENQ